MNNQNSNFLLSPTSMTTSFPFPIASPSASPSMQFYFSPVPTPIIVLPSPSPVAFHIASPPPVVLPVPSHPPQFVNRNSSVRSVSRDCSRISPYPDSNHSFSFTSASSDEIPQYLSSPNYADQEGYSRHASPERDEDTMNKLESEEVLSLKHAQMIPRDSKQNLVNKVEPLVDDLIGDLYAKEEDYRANRNGRFGPPVLRGDDVLFIPAKKQISLENVVEFLEAIQSNSMIVAASKVCQKKKKRQKKGFLIYLKFTSAQEAHNVLEHVYADFREKMPGVKHAIFEKPKSTITMPCVMKSPSF